MDEKLLKLSSLFKEKKYDELIFFIQSSFQNKSSQILNLLGVARLFNNKDKSSLILALSDFKQAYLKEKTTNFALEALINFINTSVDLYTLQSPLEDTFNDSSIFLNQTNDLFEEAEITFGYNEKLVSSILRVYQYQGNLNKTLFYLKKQFEKGDLDLSRFALWIFFNNYKKSWTQVEFLKYSKLFSDKIENFNPSNLIELNKKKNSKIRIGFLSSEILKKHSITYFLETIFNNYNKDKFEIYLYLDNSIEDANTNEFKSLAKKSINISNLEDIEAFNLIRRDSIDIMFDITGVTSFNRVSLFKNRLAPKQISWLGYCNTSGLDNMDYLIADKNLIYEEERKCYSEKIIYLPNIWNCHSGLNSVRSQSDTPCIKEKNITFGSFNNFNKINDRVIYVWSQILLKVKNSKLILKSSLKIDKSFLKKEFKKYGVIDSIIFLEKRKLESHYNLYKKIDIALDTFPYNGVTTTFEALSMGVPVITMKGYNFNSRCGESIIKNLGIENLIGNNEEDYILKAQNIADDQEELSKLRKKIFSTSYETPLFNTKKFSQDFFSILEKI
ncbi:peptide transporter [Candidatus Pelagibacter ubique]|uniref:O-linked N-acetylglucosamine transferase, SPINDLY family protein n=1 Tax=Pelagibacter ubique TaxID=198252 RepID=UPI0003C7F83B